MATAGGMDTGYGLGDGDRGFNGPLAGCPYHHLKRILISYEDQTQGSYHPAQDTRRDLCRTPGRMGGAIQAAEISRPSTEIA